MMGRRWLLGVLLTLAAGWGGTSAAAGPDSRAARAAQRSVVTGISQILLVVQNPFDDIKRVLVTDERRSLPYRTFISVELDGESFRAGETAKKPLHQRQVQVWLLQSDGTAVRQ